MTLFSNLRRHSKKKPAARLSKGMHLALQTPEILELVFSFLSQATLRTSASLVCHQWSTVAKGLIIHTLCWDLQSSYSEQSRADMIAKVDIAKVLDFGREYQSAPLMAALQNASEEKKLLVRELRIRAPLDTKTKLMPMIRMMTRLTTLSLERIGPKVVISLDEILAHCPHLCFLVLDSPWRWYRGAYKELVAAHEPPDVILSASSLMPSPLKLKVLHLGFMCIAPDSLRLLLEACVELVELRLHRVSRHRTPEEQELLPTSLLQQERRFVPIDWMALFGQMGSPCPNLARFHFMEPNGEFWDQPRLNTVLEWFPFLTEIGYGGDNPLLPVVVRSVEYYMDRLTTLALGNQNEIWPTRGHDFHFADILHDYLCSSPLLLHLYASMAVVPLDQLDFGKISEVWGSSSYTICRPQTWACRNLKTLHLGFARRLNDAGLAVNSRLVFGYISRVCPQLEDVSIGRRMVVLTVDGGLCLLTQLTRLKRLRIWTDSFKDSWIQDEDMSWIQRDAPVFSTLERLSYWRWIQKLEEKEKKYHGAFYLQKQKDCEVVVVDGMIMTGVGWIKDVLRVLKDRVEKKWVCWPELESFEMVFDAKNMKHDVMGDGPGLMSLMKKYRPGLRLVWTHLDYIMYPTRSVDGLD